MIPLEDYEPELQTETSQELLPDTHDITPTTHTSVNRWALALLTGTSQVFLGTAAVGGLFLFFVWFYHQPYFAFFMYWLFFTVTATAYSAPIFLFADQFVTTLLTKTQQLYPVVGVPKLLGTTLAGMLIMLFLTVAVLVAGQLPQVLLNVFLGGTLFFLVIYTFMLILAFSIPHHPDFQA